MHFSPSTVATVATIFSAVHALPHHRGAQGNGGEQPAAHAPATGGNNPLSFLPPGLMSQLSSLLASPTGGAGLPGMGFPPGAPSGELPSGIFPPEGGAMPTGGAGFPGFGSPSQGAGLPGFGSPSQGAGLPGIGTPSQGAGLPGFGSPPDTPSDGLPSGLFPPSGPAFPTGGAGFPSLPPFPTPTFDGPPGIFPTDGPVFPTGGFGAPISSDAGEISAPATTPPAALPSEPIDLSTFSFVLASSTTNPYSPFGKN